MKYQTLPWIAGNPLALRIPLQKVTITTDGHETEDYEPQDGDVVSIILRSQRSEKTYVPEIDGNIATISDNGTLLIGEYAVETLVVESDGTKRRSYYPFVLNVMKATPDMLAYFDDFPEYGDGVLLDTPSIFFAVGGGTIDAYTKEESDARFVNKVELTAYSTTQQMLAAIASALNGYATQQYVNGKVQDEATRATGAEQALQTALDTIEAVIPSAASSSNQLADKNFVNSSISTNTATFMGTFNSLAELQAVTGATNNDYGFVIEHDTVGNEYYDRYKYNGTQWLFEYKVESTPFTAAQWAAIQSGITSALVTKLTALPTVSELTTMLNGKQDTINDLADIRSGAALGATAVQPSALDGKEDKVDIVAASGTTLTAEVGKYYTLSNVGTLAITLPTIASGTAKVQTVTFYIAAGSSPGVTFTSTHTIIYPTDYKIEANGLYEISAAWNGIGWIIGQLTLEIPT